MTALEELVFRELDEDPGVHGREPWADVALEIASDLSWHSAALAGQDPAALMPYVMEWLKKARSRSEAVRSLARSVYDRYVEESADPRSLEEFADYISDCQGFIIALDELSDDEFDLFRHLAAVHLARRLFDSASRLADICDLLNEMSDFTDYVVGNFILLTEIDIESRNVGAKPPSDADVWLWDSENMIVKSEDHRFEVVERELAA
ncbi:hypothetical protein [Bradyrhizobium sp. AZCC 2289]|uniref:hypothetical protein n=1 Tax=Bradyrhizobium sp. AZCC 2289 TaxID=3117026 RepID=UPI002FF13425